MRRVAVIIVASMLAACGSSITDGTTGPGGGGNPTGLAGTYDLKSVDGKTPLPVASGDSSFLSGRMVLTDTTWNQTIVVRYLAGGSGNPTGDSLFEAGRWTSSNGKITLLDASSSENYTGTLTSGGFTLTSKTSTLLTYAK